MRKIFLIALLPVTALLTSCRDTKVEKVTFTAPDGSKTEFRMDDGDDRISSGFKGNHSFREVRSLQFSVLETSYKVTTDSSVYYFPFDHSVEIPK